MIGIRIRIERWDNTRWNITLSDYALWIDCGHFTIDIGRLPV